MDLQFHINELSKNGKVFKDLLTDLSDEELYWKPDSGRWCLLEIICHLYDEERDDFRARVLHVLNTPELPLPLTNPMAWVTERKYINQDYKNMLEKFLHERENSVEKLNSLDNPNWENFIEHPKHGKLRAKMFMTNWVAHDYLHIRQIIKLKYDYLEHLTGENLLYAGEW